VEIAKSNKGKSCLQFFVAAHECWSARWKFYTSICGKLIRKKCKMCLRTLSFYFTSVWLAAVLLLC